MAIARLGILTLIGLGGVCGLMLLSSCASQPQQQISPPLSIAPSVDYSAPKQMFGEPILVITEEELFALSEEQKAEFSRYLTHFLNESSPAHQRVFDYLDRATQNFHYQAKTYTAKQTLAQLQGNCMSLAVLTTALARQAKVDIRYQLVDSSPIFYRENSVIFKGVHVRSKLYQPKIMAGNAYFTRTSLVVDYLPDDNTRFIGNIDHAKFMSLYYGNRVVEYLAQNQLTEAYWYARKALEYSPSDAAAINSMAVIFRRAGDDQKAEQIYTYGIATADDKLSLLKNYRILLQSQQRFDEVDAVTQQLATHPDASPFALLQLAGEAYERGDDNEAANFYKKAVDVAPYLDYGYMGLAKVNFRQGDYIDAKKMLLKALENTFKEDGKQLYKAKLAALEKHIAQH